MSSEFGLPSGDLIAAITTITPLQKPIRTSLSTDQQVFARITDGIYRMPSSALRELISNSYDADATSVTIDMDAPRFDTISVRDNGNGMSAAALANLIDHIGGSLKRRHIGSSAGVTSETDPFKSPGGRQLIGKIGIGLFAVSQLTSRFQIITKEKNLNQRLIATITLRQYTEDEIISRGTSNRFETGTAEIIAVPAEDTDSSGTNVILLDIKPQARKILRSSERWAALDRTLLQQPDGNGMLTYHIGRFDDKACIITPANLPWTSADSADERFNKLVEAVIARVGVSPKLPTIEETLDNYLGMLWSLSLAAPLAYAFRPPWELRPSDGISAYSFDGASGTNELRPSNDEPFNNLLFFAPKELSSTPFDVVIDGVNIRRPIVFRNLSRHHELVTTPLLFVDSRATDLSSHQQTTTGGSHLNFSGYLFWTSKVVPKENNGVLIRINNASGTGFDRTFMSYRTNEQQRLRQFSAEIYISEGLDAALNIDRESFNFSHPHYQILSNWLHRSLTRAITRQKRLGQQQSDVRREERAAAIMTRSDQIATLAWKRQRGNDEAMPLAVGELIDLDIGSINDTDESRQHLRNLRALRDDPATLSKLNAIATLLDAYDLFAEISDQEKLRILAQVAEVLQA